MKTTISTPYIYVFLLVCVLFSSCEKELEYRGDETDPLLVLNSMCSVGDLLECTVWKSKFFLADNRYDVNGLLVDATVEYRVNEGEWTAMTVEYFYGVMNPSPRAFVSEYIVKAGDVVELRASHPDVESTAYAKQIAPSPLKAEVLDYVVDKKAGKLTLDFRLPPYDGNDISLAKTLIFQPYVQCELEVYDATTDDTIFLFVQENKFTLFDSKLIAAAQEDVSVDSFFEDLGITESNPNEFYEIAFPYSIIEEPREISLEIDLNYYAGLDPAQSEASPMPIEKIVLHNIYLSFFAMSEEYQLFSQSMEDADASANGMFSEKVQVYDNIEGGVGIFLLSSRQYIDVYSNPNQPDMDYGDGYFKPNVAKK